MNTFSARTRIGAAPETVWSMLTDDADVKVEGTVALGEKVTFHHREFDPKVRTVQVTAFEPRRR